MTPPLSRAIILATRAHGDQRDKAGEPIILHALRVMLAVASADRIVAVLHDVAEDTVFSLTNLALEGFEAECDALDALTRRPREPYRDFIQRAGANATSRRVKIADLRDNLDPERMAKLPAHTRARLEPRYRYALLALGAA